MWNSEYNFSVLFVLRLNPYAASQLLNVFLADRQSDPAAVWIYFFVVVKHSEQREQLAHVVLLDADARVDDAELDLSVVTHFGRHRNAACKRKLERVRHQVEQHLLDAASV